MINVSQPIETMRTEKPILFDIKLFDNSSQTGRLHLIHLEKTKLNDVLVQVKTAALTAIVRIYVWRYPKEAFVSVAKGSKLTPRTTRCVPYRPLKKSPPVIRIASSSAVAVARVSRIVLCVTEILIAPINRMRTLPRAAPVNRSLAAKTNFGARKSAAYRTLGSAMVTVIATTDPTRSRLCAKTRLVIPTSSRVASLATAFTRLGSAIQIRTAERVNDLDLLISVESVNFSLYRRYLTNR